MIFRKPYAFLIKNFKLFHAVMTIVTFYLIYKSTSILSFLGNYVSYPENIVGQIIAKRYFNIFMFLGLIVVIIMATAIFILMKLKDKPIVFYIFNMCVYIYLFILFIFTNNVFGLMEIEIVDIRIIKAIHDLFVAGVFLEFITLCLSFIRAIGLDVRKFDFNRDLQELNVEEKDNEEFEVDVELDTDRVIRKIRRKLRHAKYVYVENRFFINIALVVILVFIGGTIYLNTRDHDKIYRQNQSFRTNDFKINIRNSYLTKYDFEDKKISDNYTFLIVSADVNSNYEENKKMENAKMPLIIGNLTIYPTTKYADDFRDLGINYENYGIEVENVSTYTFIYAVPNHLAEKKMYYGYKDSRQRRLKVKLAPLNLDKEQVQSMLLGQSFKFENGILSHSTLKATKFEIQDSFKIDYDFCISQNECLKSVEILNPKLDQNYDESLVRLGLEFTTDESYNNNSILNIEDIVSKFCVIKYKLKDDTKEYVIRPVVKRSINVSDRYHVYVEVDSNIKEAEKINLEFQIRNQIIQYKIK